MATILDRITSSQFVTFLLFAIASVIVVDIVLAILHLTSIAAWMTIILAGLVTGFLVKRYIPTISDYLHTHPLYGIFLLAAIFGVIGFVSPFLISVQTPYAITGPITISFSNVATLFGNAVNQGITGLFVGGVFGVGAILGALL
ncbi:MAG: hypothetical protein ACP5GJ_04365 [Nanopusillaceae archaeon]